MTRYAVDKLLWHVAKQPALAQEFFANPQVTLQDYELDTVEYGALEQMNLRAIFRLGAHPFLLYSFAIAKNGGWSVSFMQDYVEQLSGLELGDIET